MGVRYRFWLDAIRRPGMPANVTVVDCMLHMDGELVTVQDKETANVIANRLGATIVKVRNEAQPQPHQ